MSVLMGLFFFFFFLSKQKFVSVSSLICLWDLEQC